MAKMSLEFAGFAEFRNKLNKLGADTKAITEEALKETHKIVTAKAESAMAAGNLPAGGDYSIGRTVDSLLKTPEISWRGTEGSVKVGFNIKTGGLASVFLMYGTPRMSKVQVLYDAFFGDQTIGEVSNAQKEIFYKALGELE